jgi:RimJ/RimL family protein N-acetyltransferase
MDRSRVDFSIRTKTTNEYIGFCGLINVDRTVKKAELYIVIGKKSEQGKGIGTEAYLLTTNYGFLELGLNRIYGFQNTDNIAALKAVKKIGWELEGRLRQDLWAHGKMYDRNIVSILRNDWENSRIYDI